MNGKAMMSLMDTNQSPKTAEDLEFEAIDKKLTEELLKAEAMNFTPGLRRRLAERRAKEQE